MFNKKHFLLMVIVLFLLSGCSRTVPVVKGHDSYKEKHVLITNDGSYFRVKLDFTGGTSHRQVGEEYSEGILRVVPDYEALVDSYLKEVFYNTDIYEEMLRRAVDLKFQLSQDYRDEIEGMASNFTGKISKRGDNKLSLDEFYMFNFIPDIMRQTQCCFISVFNSRSSTGKTITARNLDWFGGSAMQISRFQAVITMKSSFGNICSIGYLGYMGILTAFNDKKVFAAILDSPTGQPYSAQGRRSYPFDLRFALESKTSMDEIADYMKDTSKFYTFNHLIALSDPHVSKVLENNFSGMGPNNQRVMRALRVFDSQLNKDITWGIKDAIGSVNSFILKGNYDNHTPNKYNTKRWKNMKRELQEKGETLTVGELKEVVSYGEGSPGTFNESGHLYNRLTSQIIIFQPDTLELEVAFHPKDKNWAKKPVFEKVSIKW